MRSPHFPNASRSRGDGCRRGYTLLELLVVIGVIALLVSMLLPSLRRSMTIASQTVCMHHLRDLGISLRLYRYDNDGWLPNAAPAGSGSMLDEMPEPWFLKLYPTHLRDFDLLSCPDDPYKFRMKRIGSTPDAPEVGSYPSYGINSFIMLAGGGFLADLDRHEPTRPLNTLLLADAGPDYPTESSEDGHGQKGPNRNVSLMSVGDGFDPFSRQPINPWITGRHVRKINALTLDGHVQEVRTWDIMQSPVQSYYEPCEAGGCTLCRYLDVDHYSFARDRLFWWTGPVPVE